MRRLSIALMVVFGWLVLAVALDRLVVAPGCGACVQAAALEVKLRVPAVEVTYPTVSVLVLLVLPLMLLAAAMVPWRDLRSRQAWSHAVESWWEPTFWLLIALALTAAAESVYVLARAYLPQSVTAMVQEFALVGTFSVHVPGYAPVRPLAVSASLAGLVGLAIGAWLFVQNGLNGVMRWFKA